MITESSDEYADTEEQLRIIRVIEAKYGRIHGGNLRVDWWGTYPDYLLVELSNTREVVESCIQADYYARYKVSYNTRYLKVNRETLEVEGITKEQMIQLRGWFTDDRGIMHWIK